MNRIPSILIGALLLASVAGAHETHAKHDGDPNDPVSVASAYLASMEASDLDAVEALFAEESSVFESGGAEGTWQNYRAHHIGPELDQIVSFAVTKGDPESRVSDDGGMAFVAWPIEYQIVLADDRVIDSKGTVTFILVKEGGQLRIRHLHWSSRRKQ